MYKMWLRIFVSASFAVTNDIGSLRVECHSGPIVKCEVSLKSSVYVRDAVTFNVVA